PGPGLGRSVDVPRYSQMIHRGHYPQWGGGGRAWCSPTSMAMVLAAWKRGPRPKEYAWVNDGYRDPWVEHAARMVYDHRYEGTGNWPFTTAYAGTRGLDAFVTRLPSLRAAERYITARIPLVLSIAFGRGELDGAPLASSNGHLLVLRGFTRGGRPIVNDPAAPRNAGVRRIYRRAQLERAWLTSTAGTTYVVRPSSVPLPAREGAATP
ncbi:MAG: C39 family peptidase, partial [Nocardioidaceae bacterium]|nr:C39 family peptidase [Nocardioidaceae bacterium]